MNPYLLKNQIAAMQADVDELKESPQYKQYVEQHNLRAIDSKYKIVDELLEKGYLK